MGGGFLGLPRVEVESNQSQHAKEAKCCAAKIDVALKGLIHVCVIL